MAGFYGIARPRVARAVLQNLALLGVALTLALTLALTVALSVAL